MIKKHPYFIVVFSALVMFVIGCSVSKDPMRTPIKQLQKGKIKEDTSYVYTLPYAINTTHQVVQGYFSNYSHKNRVAIDFKMKKGTPVCAARNGVVVRIKEDGQKGGLKNKYRQDGNFIVIKQGDGSSAGYWHLQLNGALVNVGDTVIQGQPIGLSGKTGYALFPHLHFLVWRNNKDGHRQQIATRFKTSGGNVYLRPLRRYRNNNY